MCSEQLRHAGLVITGESGQLQSASALVELVATWLESVGGSWAGTAEMLFEELTQYAEESEIDVTQKGWPANAAWLSRRLQGFKRELRSVGIEVERRKESSGTRRQTIRLWLVPEPGEDDEPDEPDLPDPDPDDEPDDEPSEHIQAARDSLAKDREREEARDKIRGCVTYTPGSDRKYRDW